MKKGAVLILLALSACATTKSNYRPLTEQISFPDLDKVTSVSIGEEMVKQGTYTEQVGISLAEDNNIRGYQFSRGFYPQVGEDERYTYHSYQAGNGLNGMGALKMGSGLFAVGGDAVSLRATKGTNELCVDRIMGAKACDTERGYTRTKRPSIAENNFQQTLLYNGRVGDRIKVGYREFTGDIARPAFSNEVEYDLSSSKEISYRGVKLLVLSADNTKIEYRLLSNFNMPR